MKDFKMPKKILSVLLAVSMMLSCVPVPAYAVTTDNLCDHHTSHTADCGYVEAVAGSPCTHEHSEDCYAILACLHTCGDECEDPCTHECTVENGCVTMELDCHHTHGDCGYSEGTAEVPCGHVHNESCGYAEAVAGTPCANAETDPECDHSGDCGYVAAVAGQPCGHTEHTDCGYAPATEGTPCTHTHAVKVDSADSCYKLLCSHKDGGHDDTCGYVAATPAHECHYECAECAAEATTEPSTEATEPAPVCYCVEKCTAESFNEYCDVCGFDYTQCGSTDTAAVYVDAECTHSFGTDGACTGCGLYKLVLGTIQAADWVESIGGELATDVPAAAETSAAGYSLRSASVSASDLPEGTTITVTNTTRQTAGQDYHTATYTWTDGVWTSEDYILISTDDVIEAACGDTTLPTDQSGGVSGADRMTASGTATQGEALDLTFSHRLTKVTVKVTTWNSEFANAEKYLSEVSIYTKVDTPITAYEEGDGIYPTFTAILPVGSYNANQTFMTLLVNGGQELTVPVNGFLTAGLEAGYHYTFNLTVGQELLEISKVTVTDWDSETKTTCATVDSADNGEFNAATFEYAEVLVSGTSIGVTVTNESNPAYNASNVKYTCNEAASEWLTEKAPYWNSESNITAYYPYSESGSIPYDLATGGELLYGTATASGSSASLNLDRKLAKLRVYISGLPEGTDVDKMELSGIYTAATFDGSTGTLTPISKGAIGLDLWGETLLIPMTEEEVTLRILLSDDSVYTTTMKLAPTAGTEHWLTVNLEHTAAASYTVNEEDSTKHDAYYSCCGTTVTEDHSGGTATCAHGKICEKCGSEYGEVDTTNHDSSVAFNEKGFCPNCGEYEPATDSDGDGYYEIGNAGQLFWFAEQINGGAIANTSNAVLTADIDLENRAWTPIGIQNEAASPNVKLPYQGTFNGQNHVIKNLNVHVTDGREAGLFGRATSATLTNFGVENATVVSDAVNGTSYRAGIIAGELHMCTVTNVYSAGNLTVTTDHAQAGGIAGECASSTLTGCYTTYGCLTANNAALPTGVTNCYYLAESENAGSCGEFKTADQFASGEVAYLLQGEQTEQVWGQLIGIEKYPVLGGEKVLTDDSGGYYNDCVNVLISWTAMEFTYTAGEWDPETHTYSGGSWAAAEGGGQITVTNLGGRSVTAKLTFTPVMEGISGSFDQPGAHLVMGGSFVSTLTLTGTPAETGFTNEHLGNVVVTITGEDTALGGVPDHTPGTEITYTWAEDFSTCTAFAVCTECGGAVEVETVHAVYAVTTSSTCTVKGTGTYTATFTAEGLTAQTKEVELPLDPDAHSFAENGKCACGAIQITDVNAPNDADHPFGDGWSNDEEAGASIGTQDVGKTAWEKDDQIIVTLISETIGTQTCVLTYNGGNWTLDGSFVYAEGETPTVTAVYAPSSTPGMGEYIPAVATINGNSISISFEDATRDYSRLRIVGQANTTYTVTTTGFTPAGATTVATEAYTLTTDDKGNAYLYGTFAKDATVTVKQGGMEATSHTFTTATVLGKSYALNALGYDYDKGTNTYTVYSPAGLLAWGEAARAVISTGTADTNNDWYAEYTTDMPNLTLAADITLTGENNWTPLGYVSVDKSTYYPYIGTIDGNGHTITGLNINSTGDYIAFVGSLGPNSEVKNLTFKDATIIGGENVATVAADCGGNVTNCHVTGSSSVSGNNLVAGVVAWNGAGIISGCTNAATVTVNVGDVSAGSGGVVGTNILNGIVIGCFNSGDITASASNRSQICGGVVGLNTTESIIIACGNTGKVVSSVDGVGGIAGGNYGVPVYACWTKETTEFKSGTEVSNKDGVGTDQDNTSVLHACYSFADTSAVADAITAMNTAIDEYNASAAEGRKCTYKWQVGTDGYPTLVEIDQSPTE